MDEQYRYKFQRCYHIVDSQIVQAMIQKDSYGFNTFAATQIGEIQETTKKLVLGRNGTQLTET